MLEAYQNHVATRAAEGLVPEPLSAEWTSLLVERLQDATLDDGDVLLDLLTHRVPAGVDEAAYIKAGFLAAIAAGEAVSPIVTPKRAVELLGTMLGGYNVAPLIEALKNPELSDTAVEGLSRTLLVFDAFHDVKALADQGLMAAQKVLKSWAAADWFTARPKVPETITVTVFKVPGEINTDDLSPAQDAWSRPDIPLHAKAMLKVPREGVERRLWRSRQRASRWRSLVMLWGQVRRENRRPIQSFGTSVTISLMSLISGMGESASAVRSRQFSSTPWRIQGHYRSSVMSTG